MNLKKKNSMLLLGFLRHSRRRFIASSGERSAEHLLTQKQNVNKLTLGQINTINHYFKADPILKINGVCCKCYEVSLPLKGFGVRYLYKGQSKEIPPNGIIKEIRFSARKSLSCHGGNSKPYVTELVVAPAGINAKTENGSMQLTNKGDEIWTMINPSTAIMNLALIIKEMKFTLMPGVMILINSQ